MEFIYQQKFPSYLVPGIHVVTLVEFVAEFGFNFTRKRMINSGLIVCLNDLYYCGCKIVYIGGSFTTKLSIPADYDLCWETDGVDFEKLKSEFAGLNDFSLERTTMHQIYLGDIFPANAKTRKNGSNYLSFFQRDRNNIARGIVQINLENCL